MECITKPYIVPTTNLVFAFWFQIKRLKKTHIHERHAFCAEPKRQSEWASERVSKRLSSEMFASKNSFRIFFSLLLFSVSIIPFYHLRESFVIASIYLVHFRHFQLQNQIKKYTVLYSHFFACIELAVSPKKNFIIQESLNFRKNRFKYSGFEC